jgi:predicted dehydrogenase
MTNWAILGLGRIAHKFAEDLRRVPGARLWAVASTSEERAAGFARTYDVPNAFGRYEDLVSCPGIDVVYVATPHVGHCAATLLCLENGLPVLCEKPFAMNAAEAGRMIDAARQHDVFLMEALWTRFIPAVAHALVLVGRDEIGEIHTVKADFGFTTPFDPQSRLFNKALGGGALLDIGIYPAALALLVFGKPGVVQAMATFGPTEVDESCAFMLRFGERRLALGHATLAAHTPIEATLYGTEGHIYLHPRFHHTQKLTVTRYSVRDQSSYDLDFPFEGWGYHFEAQHVGACLQAGKKESELLPLEFSRDLMETLDAIRREIGLNYE